MRLIVWMLAALLLAACQQPVGNTTPSSGDSSRFSGLGNEQFGAEKDGQMRYFRSEGDATAKELALRLLEACYGKMQSQDQSGFQACMRDQMTTAFDDSGKGRAACRQFSALDAYADCMVVGNMVLDIRHRLDDDTPVAADFWSSKDTMVHAMVKSVVIGATANCMSRGSESEMLACAVDWFTKQLDLPDEYVQRCRENKSDEDREGCLGEAVTLRYMRTHMDRIAKDSI